MVRSNVTIMADRVACKTQDLWSTIPDNIRSGHCRRKQFSVCSFAVENTFASDFNLSLCLRFKFFRWFRGFISIPYSIHSPSQPHEDRPALFARTEKALIMTGTSTCRTRERSSRTHETRWDIVGLWVASRSTGNRAPNTRWAIWPYWTQ